MRPRADTISALGEVALEGLHLNGLLETIAFGELVQILAQGRKTGTIELVSGREMLRFVMRSGDLVNSLRGTDDQNEGRVFEALVGAGILGSLERHEVLRIAHARGKPGLEVLLAMGIVAARSVEPVLRRLLAESFIEAFGWHSGHFAFRVVKPHEEPALPVQTRVAELLLASIG